MEIIIGRQGTQKTPITDPTVSRKHCKVTDNGDGTFTIENLSSLGTKVDGVDIVRKTANINSILQLGPTFSAPLGDLIGQVNSQPQISKLSLNETKTFDISHLKEVWESFNNKNIQIANSQRQINLIRGLLGVFTMGAMPTIFFLGPIGYILTGIGVVGNIYSFVGMKNVETAEVKQRRLDEFDDKWICPNPDCGRSLIARNYRLLIRNYQSCPYCKCKYVEK
ncbi:MAG: FHA domain-containing protein [Muribaculaceae bacterium]|nr:FHA domain-containing protein [Muribaculaceae bacterium]MDE6643910.1 FHA domain-containing protein [Muribaculaceae bacterium]